MISSNIGEVISIFFSSILGLPDGFNSIQLLWVNLVTDGLPAMCLSFNPPDADIMIKPPRSSKDGIVNSWMIIRYMAIGLYIGIATVGVFLYWYLKYDWATDGHQLVELSQLRSWGSCPNWSGFAVSNFDNFDFSKNPCTYFTIGKAKASTLSLSVLVMIEMFNTFNAISENQSLLVTGIMVNPYLIAGVISSMLLHCVIIYIPSMNFLFSTLPMDLNVSFLII
jgi:P-type Ca2+ transporter type 2C